MADPKTILVIGTYDTKPDELEFIEQTIIAGGGKVLTMDVSVLGDAPRRLDIIKQKVASAAGSSIETAIASGNENTAMQIMADGAAVLTASLYHEDLIDGMIALGGTMGTDLALDCANALPMGVPKYIVSTVSFSPLIPAERLPADIQMILWAGGLYGLNSICKASLAQAAGAVLGAANAAQKSQNNKPIVAMTSLGKSCLSYMVTLKPELEKRGFEVAVFHSTGMGGRAFESLAGQGAFACVMDFCMQEFTNGVHGSVVNSGTDRLTNAGRARIPQIVAPGASDLVDMPTWQPVPQQWLERPYHAHNRLIASVAISPDERRHTAREIAKSLGQSLGPVHFILPVQGIEEWDRQGEPAYDPQGLEAFVDEIKTAIKKPVELTVIDAHINDQAFCQVALEIFDNWVAKGIIQKNS